jgi:hypothetical protein
LIRSYFYVRSGMDRRQVMHRLLFFAAIAAVLAALVTFKIKVAMAGGKYLLALVVIIGLVWFLTRSRK